MQTGKIANNKVLHENEGIIHQYSILLQKGWTQLHKVLFYKHNFLFFNVHFTTQNREERIFCIPRG